MEKGTDAAKRELIKCTFSASYFINTYCQIYDATSASWIPFHLWPEQERTLQTLVDDRLVIILKARQLGQTWLCLSYALYKMIFHSIQTVMLFSRREEEAIYMLRERLKKMYLHLPEWMRNDSFRTDSAHEWRLDNDSVAYAFPTTAGDSYTASLVIVDEADLVPSLSTLMTSVKPTIDGGGEMILLSRSNKEQPRSPFKSYYRAAKKGNNWTPVFLPWQARPSRTQGWYLEQKLDILSRTGYYDDLWEQYPETDAQALAPKMQSKRIPGMWVEKNHVELEPLVIEDLSDAPALPALEIYQEPMLERSYVIGADPAEGNPGSDDSSLTVLDEMNQEEVAALTGKVEPTVFADYIDQIGVYFNNAPVLVERNNHGHAVIAWLKEHSTLELLKGQDGKHGWQTSGKSKSAMYTVCAEQFRDGLIKIHSLESKLQLMAVEGATLKAPRGEHDDRATGFALAIQALHLPKVITTVRDYTKRQTVREPRRRSKRSAKYGRRNIRLVRRN